MTLAEAVETIKKYCEGRECKDCVFQNMHEGEWLECTYGVEPCYWKTPTETNIYDQEEIHENCTVQLLRNSITGEVSVGWWDNE